jgi:large conductance mechanosensitive channel
MLTEFKEFALRGNVADMAVGVIIGAAFGKIVDSFVADVIMPPIGVLLGGTDFSNLFVVLKAGADGVVNFATLAEAKKAGAVTWNLGLFFNTIVSFLIVAVAIFLLVREMNRMRRPAAVAPAAAPTTKDCPFCLNAIPLAASRCGHCTEPQPGT